MIVKLNYDDMKGTSLSVMVGKAIRKPDIIMKVNQSNVEDAVSKYYNSVSAFLYTDSVESLLQFKDLKITKMRVVIDLSTVDIENNIADTIIERMALIPKECVAVVKLPKNYSDMRTLSNLSAMFSNLRLCGGMLFNFPSVRLGCIDEKDTERQRKCYTYVNTCCCIEKPEYLEDLEYKFTENVVADTGSSKPKVKKAKPSMPSYVKYGGIDSF